MKTIFAFIIIVLFSSCITVINTPGPDGRDGQAYFGIDYDSEPPYSYWDNNPSIPENPSFNFYYPTLPGIYEFEYFINPVEYWYGSYEIWINPGGRGGSYGEPGLDGADTFLMLICDPYGYYEYRDAYYKTSVGNKDSLVIEKKFNEHQYRITIKKGNINDRPAHQPKYNNEI